jgi:hypothetical protein
MRAVCICRGLPQDPGAALGGQRGACRGSRIAAAREHLGFRVSRRSFTLVGFGSGPGGGQRTLMTPPDGPYLSAPGGRVPRAGRSCSRVRGVAGRRSGLLCGCGCAAQPLAPARSWSGRCTATTRTCRRCPGGRLASSGAATLWLGSRPGSRRRSRGRVVSERDPDRVVGQVDGRAPPRRSWRAPIGWWEGGPASKRDRLPPQRPQDRPQTSRTPDQGRAFSRRRVPPNWVN